MSVVFIIMTDMDRTEPYQEPVNALREDQVSPHEVK